MEKPGSGKPKRADDHGGLFTPVKKKKQRVKSPEVVKAKFRLARSASIHKARCCNCNTNAKCANRKCACKLKKMPCTACTCKNCTNRLPLKTYCQAVRAPVPETDESPAPARATTTDEKTPPASTTTATIKVEKVVETVDPDDEETPTDDCAINLEVGDESRGIAGFKGKDQHQGGTRTTAKEEQSIGDLPGATISDADRKLNEVFGDHVHQNDGTHLDGGIADDKVWQDYHRRLIVYPAQKYDLPKGGAGTRFVNMLATLWEGVQERRWNSERLLVFSMVILQRTRDVKKTGDVRRRIKRRMDDWENGKFDMLVETTERDLEANLSIKRGCTTPEQRLKTFNQKLLRGDLRGAVKYLSETEKGGVLLPDEVDEKSGETVLSVLESKHPDARTPDAASFPDLGKTPDFVDLDITGDTVEKVAGKLSGSAGVSGSDSQAISWWLLGFGSASERLRRAIASHASWMANDFPPWAAYRALMTGRLLALDKCPGVRPIGIGETWRRAIAKCVLLIAGKDAKNACGIDQLCAGLESGIEGGIHHMQRIWDAHQMEEEWGFLLIDARNAFNELNRTVMLWSVRHLWPAGARFTFNCYKHWPILVIRGKAGTGTFLFSKEGVTQGDPLSMFAYGIGILPLIRQLKREFPDMDQTWFADDASTAAKFGATKKFFERLKVLGPFYGYFPEMLKSIIVVTEANREAAEKFFREELGNPNFVVTTGSRYLGGFIGEDKALDDWLGEKLHYWETTVLKLATAAKNYPQSAYSALQRSLQQEWQFVQRVVRGIGDKFTGVEKAISRSFLPALFGDVIEDDDPRLKLAHLPVKSAGLALENAVESADRNIEGSILAVSHMLQAMKRDGEFRPADHTATIQEVRTELRSRRSTKNASDLKAILEAIPSCDDKRTILRGKETGIWLSVPPSIVNGTCLSAQEFRDSLMIRYAREPADFPSICDGCGKPFSVPHALECKKGGNVICRHDEVKDELCDLVGRAMIPSAVRDEPKIYPNSRAAELIKDSNNKNTVSCLKRQGEERGDLLVRGLWQRGHDAIIDVRITDTDCKSAKNQDPAKVLEKHERLKKKKYLEACLEQRRHFTPFVVSTDGLIGRESKTLLRRISALMAEKSGKTYSQVCGYVNARMSIAIVRATHLCLRGSRIPTSQMSNRRPLWEDSSGLRLFKSY